MKIFLAGTASNEEIIRENPPRYILESFYYIKKWQVEIIQNTDDFLLDSGAFTFIRNCKNIRWEEYIEKYADFIKENNIAHFFELDIDSVVGYEKVLRYRKLLETLTNKQCIPVWHKTRGVDEYKQHCHEYDYVGIGGYAIKELKPREYEAFPSMINYAHKNNAKVHCLGFTNTAKLKKYRFDSVDSTTWIVGAKYANVCNFQNNIMTQTHYFDKRCIDVQGLARHNLKEWVKFQRYAERNL